MKKKFVLSVHIHAKEKRVFSVANKKDMADVIDQLGLMRDLPKEAYVFADSNGNTFISKSYIDTQTFILKLGSNVPGHCHFVMCHTMREAVNWLDTHTATQATTG